MDTQIHRRRREKAEFGPDQYDRWRMARFRITILSPHEGNEIVRKCYPSSRSLLTGSENTLLFSRAQVEISSLIRKWLSCPWRQIFVRDLIRGFSLATYITRPNPHLTQLYHDDGSGIFLRNVDLHLHDFRVSQSRRHNIVTNMTIY
jgi:hypothetical protein